MIRHLAFYFPSCFFLVWNFFCVSVYFFGFGFGWLDFVCRIFWGVEVEVLANE